MTEPTIICPNCQTEIKLTESLAAPLVESTRREFQAKLSAKDREIHEKEEKLQREREAIDEEVKAKLKQERIAITETEAKRAREAVSDELTKAQQEAAAKDELLKDRNTKLAQAQKNELELRAERQKLQDEKAQFEIEKQRAIDAERASIRESAQKEADEQSRLKIAEKEKTINDLQTKLQDALRKAEQGSQQLQGEVFELELEALLRAKFPTDSIEPVAKGKEGGDVLQRVMGPLGQPCGSILWESKRTKNWSDGWLSKLREDQRAAKAEVAMLLSQVLPKGVVSFDLIDGVWVVEPRCSMPLAIALRQSLIDLTVARQAGEGQQTKMELVYQYLTGPRFKLRVEAIVEKFSDMQNDLDKERKSTMRMWAKREEQIRGVIESTAGMYGDLQGIAGRSLQEISGLSILALGDGPDSGEKEDGT